MARKVGEIIDLETEPGAPPPRDAEQAVDALGGIAFVDGEGNPTATPPPPRPTEREAPPATKKVRRSKAELEAEVDRLAAEVERRQAEAAAHAPDVIESMKAPLAMTFAAAFEAAAAFRGEHWKLADSQATALGAVWAPVVGPMVQSHPELVVWAGAIAVSYGIVVPRVKKDRELADAKDKAAKLMEIAQ